MNETEKRADAGDVSGECPGLYPFCRARAKASSFQYAECLTPARKYCLYRHTVSWSFKFHCGHPNARRIIEHTNATMKQRGHLTG